ncbi:hypothetical protein [Chamaesiphon sp. VAR_48_metabat_403]|uniref:hypothetical protein n=1 Tax=Chamaesiphon sp. VAR_48_metabat_403 TaxID=2964700 RepID=UPI00286E6D04|nr:hypothetical protein [Chamaesiphon sp. VAR_48_metabat_403]
MSDAEETLVNGFVTYPLQVDGKFYLIENVPARIDEETGEHFFTAAVVKNLQQIVLNGKEPDRTIDTAIYNYERHSQNL